MFPRMYLHAASARGSARKKLHRMISEFSYQIHFELGPGFA